MCPIYMIMIIIICIRSKIIQLREIMLFFMTNGSCLLKYFSMSLYKYPILQTMRQNIFQFLNIIEYVLNIMNKTTVAILC